MSFDGVYASDRITHESVTVNFTKGEANNTFI